MTMPHEGKVEDEQKKRKQRNRYNKTLYRFNTNNQYIAHIIKDNVNILNIFIIQQ